jgi:16S rRNA (cytosine967-C5)-methyltransferase
MSSARRIAVKVLSRVERERAFAAAALEAELKGSADPRDASLATELVYGALRMRPWLDRLLDGAARQGRLDVDPFVRDALRVAAYQLAFLDRVPAHAVVNEAVAEIRRARGQGLAGFANAVLHKLAADRASLRPPDPAVSPDPALALGLPPWLFERLVAAHGAERAHAMGRAFNAKSRRTLRVNTARIDVEAALARLGEGSAPGQYLPWAVDAADRGGARELEEEGLAAHQDEGAGLVVAALDPKPGERILDACAGRGGKTALVAQLAGNGAEIAACDVQASKLERLAFELGRQGFFAKTAVCDLAKGAPPFEGSFDRVLVDAPCSGTGTIGRRPEIRWRLRPNDVATLARLQRAMLDRVADLVRPGGRLVFAVCSLLPEEHRAHLDPFLAAHPGFALVAEPPAIWPATLAWSGGAPVVDPGASRTDGYGVLCLERAP